MPTYEYECQYCKEKFEVFQKMTEPLITKCIKCNGQAKRLFSPGGGLIFKGSGFYITDYRSKDYKERTKKEESSQVKKEEKKKDSPKAASKDS